MGTIESDEEVPVLGRQAPVSGFFQAKPQRQRKQTAQRYHKSQMTSANSTFFPELLWAQRSSSTDGSQNLIYLSVNLPNMIEQPNVKLSKTGLVFSARTKTRYVGLLYI